MFKTTQSMKEDKAKKKKRKMKIDKTLLKKFKYYVKNKKFNLEFLS